MPACTVALGPSELSLVKAHHILRHYALRLAQTLTDLKQLQTMMHKIIARCLKRALREKRRKRFSTYQKLHQLEQDDDALTESHYAFCSQCCSRKKSQP
jgi:hypothetical protein